MRSLSARLLLGTGVVLAVFVVLTGLAVSWSVHERADAAREDRMRGLVYGILGATELLVIDGAEAPRVTLGVRKGELPDRRLAQPTAGLYAEIVGYDGERLWQSASSVEHVPPVVPTPIGEWLRETVEAPDGERLDRLQLQSVWELDDGQELPFIVQVVDAETLAGRLGRFDRSLWTALLSAAALLLIVQLGVLKAALRPLARIGEQLDEIDAGRREMLDEDLPRELAPLARRVNAFVSRERVRHARYRHLLDDLAHVLKTPLSILANLGDERVAEPVERMRVSIDRYLQRAHSETTTRHAAPIAVAAVARRVATSIGKLYASRALEIEVEVPESFQLTVPEADLLEVLGNLVDNAAKYGASRIRIVARAAAQGAPCVLAVEDDGPGLGDADPERLLGRGVRADSAGIGAPAVEGQGMGLAAVAEMLDAWGGTLLLQAREGGGTRVVMTLQGFRGAR